MGQRKFKPAQPKGRGRKQVGGAAKNRFKPRSFFRREAGWMTWMNLAPFGIGFVLALLFWFTR